ncbi:putative heme oxygenase [Nocardioides szechwanensis]|uniref:heme oxygenase (biliverdin-producing) n=1 Tax=Nocardioides szechwanensis TaxID=1005944 RepID=A0A1H0LR39_9ACTN|nr:biliverdin-producing heme oxygenase [Nocardioides szechwanensis]GEP36034.1 putative heme oxygenase [Nocardioides szechwanensis]SDO70702.1 heme oxygenase [Nocardioides szechwanensis]
MTVLDPPISTLSAAMREGSKLEHQDAEDSLFMSELLGGRVNETGYADYLLRLRGIYEAMEETVRRHAGDPVVAAVHDEALERLGAIDTDLAHWAPGRTTTVDSPATAAYRDRLHDAGEWGGLLVAHHYTRYLGDLSGGQAIGRILDRTFGLDGAGIAFYDFPAIPKPKPYKDAYRARLDGLGLSTGEVQRVVDEVKVAFRLNQALFTELGQNIDGYRR